MRVEAECITYVSLLVASVRAHVYIGAFDANGEKSNTKKPVAMTVWKKNRMCSQFSLRIPSFGSGREEHLPFFAPDKWGTGICSNGKSMGNLPVACHVCTQIERQRRLCLISTCLVLFVHAPSLHSGFNEVVASN